MSHKKGAQVINLAEDEGDGRVVACSVPIQCATDRDPPVSRWRRRLGADGRRRAREAQDRRRSAAMTAGFEVHVAGCESIGVVTRYWFSEVETRVYGSVCVQDGFLRCWCFVVLEGARGKVHHVQQPSNRPSREGRNVDGRRARLDGNKSQPGRCSYQARRSRRSDLAVPRWNAGMMPAKGAPAFEASSIRPI
jgi:hypothetical protein